MSWSKNNRLHVAVGLLWLVLSSTVFAQSDKPSAPAEEEVATFKAPPRSIKDVIRAVENGKIDETEVARAKEIIAKTTELLDMLGTTRQLGYIKLD